MYIFLILAIPLFYTLYLHINNKQKDFPIAFMVFMGTFFSVIYCFIEFFITYTYRDSVYSVFQVFPYYFKILTLIPILVCGIIVFILSKDNLIFKLEKFVPLLTGFYIIYLPYKFISINEDFDFFNLFLVPIIIFAFILTLDLGIKFIKDIVEKKLKKIALVIAIPLIVLTLIMPALICSLYYTQILPVLYYIFLVTYIVGTIVLLFFENKIETKLQYTK